MFFSKVFALLRDLFVLFKKHGFVRGFRRFLGLPKRVTLVGRDYVIEPLGILHLAGVARDLGCEVDVVLIKDGNFDTLYDHVAAWKPDIVAFTIWTGYHVQAFRACDRVLEMGAQVVIGGPHSTYFADECVKHSTWTCKGEGFKNFQLILEEKLEPGLYFDKERTPHFPHPNRALVYRRAPHLGASPIKSMFCSVGCPFRCSYCYAPAQNLMYGGFKLVVRPVDDLIREAIEIRDQYPARLIYMQDDVFGYRIDWLKEFTQRWKKEVGVPWHCQIRLELTNDERRLDLFREGGCTGITLAIESGNDFLRHYVLERQMSEELVLEGCRRITDRGMTLRTEQILSVPFSSLETDLATLDLNNRINPEMAWTSILASYGGTFMGTLSANFGFYNGNNDDLSETFFSRSVLRHCRGGPASVEGLVRSRHIEHVKDDNPLKRMKVRMVDDLHGDIHLTVTEAQILAERIGTIEYLTPGENEEYADRIVMLQRLFNWFSKVPNARSLADSYLHLPKADRSWKMLGILTSAHLARTGRGEHLKHWVAGLATEMGYNSPSELPSPIAENPWYFTFIPSGGEFARKLLSEGVWNGTSSSAQFDKIGDATRRWLFMRSLYKIEPATEPIASSRNLIQVA